MIEAFEASVLAGLLGAFLLAATSCGEAASVAAHDAAVVAAAGASDVADRDGVLAGGRGSALKRAELETDGRAADGLAGDDPAARSGRWNAPLERIVGRWIQKAEDKSKGKANARTVRVAVHVRELASGVELAARGADVPQTPASNMKLVTTAAALALLGPDVEFLTPFDALGPIEGGVLRGDLVLRACGDPVSEIDGDARVEGRLGRVARELHALGLRRVEGDLVLDEGAFLSPGPGPAWPSEDQHWQDFCALSGGFTLNGGVLQARVRSGKVGLAAELAVHPSPHGLRNNYGVKTTSSKRLDVRVGATRTTATVVGTIPAGTGLYLGEFSHPDPVQLFGNVLLSELSRAGIEIEGELRRQRDVARGRRLAELRSPVIDTLKPINSDSRNGVADQLFFAVGFTVTGKGDREGGREAVATALARLGVPAHGFVQVDGSGLSRDNRVSARQVTALLAAVLANPDGSARLYRDSLAVGGERGTLQKRLRGEATRGRVWGKTGWISGVSALSGVLRNVHGDELVFSILVEYPAALGGMNTSIFKPMQDEILTRLCEDRP